MSLKEITCLLRGHSKKTVTLFCFSATPYRPHVTIKKQNNFYGFELSQEKFVLRHNVALKHASLLSKALNCELKKTKKVHVTICQTLAV